jgi:uncharacterized OsmC-like protein
MIQVDSLSPAYRGVVRNRAHELASDAPITKGGGGAGFGAHELLEASLAACLNMAVRMHADARGIPLERVSTVVVHLRTSGRARTRLPSGSNQARAMAHSFLRDHFPSRR